MGEPDWSAVPWRLIAVSEDMMAGPGNEYPPEWQTSASLYAYAPTPDSGDCDRFVYLKVATSITGYVPTDSELAVHHRVSGI